MSSTYDFYKERYNEIQRQVYLFGNEVPLTAEEQSRLVKRFSLGTDFYEINSIQEYNEDLLLKGYKKVDIREAEVCDGKIKGQIPEPGKVLQETFVQIPRELFEVGGNELQNLVYKHCVELIADQIKEHLSSLQLQKAQIEEEMARYSALLQKM